MVHSVQLPLKMWWRFDRFCFVSILKTVITLSMMIFEPFRGGDKDARRLDVMIVSTRETDAMTKAL